MKQKSGGTEEGQRSRLRGGKPLEALQGPSLQPTSVPHCGKRRQPIDNPTDIFSSAESVSQQ